jgi:gliding motility-associated-like protein
MLTFYIALQQFRLKFGNFNKPGILIRFLLILIVPTHGYAQVFTEKFGPLITNPYLPTTYLANSYPYYSTSYTKGGIGVIANNPIPPSDYPGASGGLCVNLKDFTAIPIPEDFVIQNIDNTTGDGSISFGIYKGKASSGPGGIDIEYSTNSGSTYTRLLLPSGFFNTGDPVMWYYKTITGVPTVNNLWIRIRNTSGNASAFFAYDDISLGGTENCTPPLPTAYDVGRCGAGTVTLTAEGAYAYKWYDALTGGNLLFTGQNFTTPTLTGNTTYYVSSVTSLGCESNTRRAVSAKVHSTPSAAIGLAGSTCGPGTVLLSANNSADSYAWYSAATGGSYLSIGKDFITPYVASTTTYYVEAVNGLTCGSATRTPVTATVAGFGFNTETVGTGADALINAYTGWSSGYTMSGSGGVVTAATVVWQTAAEPGNTINGKVAQIGGGQTWQISGINASNQNNFRLFFNIRRNNVNLLISNFIIEVLDNGVVVGTLNPKPILADMSSNTWLRYRTDSTLASIKNISNLGFRFTNNSGNAGRNFQLDDIQISSSTIIPTVAITGGGPFTLTANGGSNFRWYDAPTGGTLLSSVNPYVVNPASTTTYYVTTASGSCGESTRVPVTVTVACSIASPTAVGANSCGSSALTLTASGSPGTYNWYTVSTGGLIAGTGATFVTPFLNTSATYYVSSVNGGCESSRVAVPATIVSFPVSQIPTTGLIAYYKLDGNANDFTNNNNGTFQGTPTSTTDRFGNANSAYLFNGIDQFITTTKSYNNPSDYSFSIWFKTNTLVGGRLVGFGDSQTGASSNRDRMLWMENSGKLNFGVNPGGINTVLKSPLTYNDDIWHQAVVTASSTAGIRLYVDGLLVASNSTVLEGQNYTGYWRINQDLTGWGSSPSSNFFQGSMDNIQIYERAITNSEITTIFNVPDGASSNSPVCVGGTLNLSAVSLSGASYSWTGPNGFTSTSQNPSVNAMSAATSGTYSVTITNGGCSAIGYTLGGVSTLLGPNLTQPSTSLQSRFMLDGNAKDLMGVNHGSLINNPTLTTDRFGNANSAYQLNGTNQYLTTSNAYSNPNNFTISVWFKTTTTNGGKIMGFSANSIGGSGSYDRHLYMGNSGRLYYGVNPVSGMSVINTPSAYNDGEWHNAVASTGAAGSKLFVDGVLIASDPVATGGEAFTGYWRVGYENLSGWPNVPARLEFNGSIDDVSIYSTQLSDAQVISIYNSNQGPGSNSPTCIGGSLNLTGPTIAGASYSWTGPNGFTSTSQNPTVPSMSAAKSGNYALTVTSSSGCISTGYTIAEVNYTAGPNLIQPITGLQSRYMLDGNPKDLMAVNHGTVNNNPTLTTDRFGNANSAYQLNGTNQFITSTTSYSDPNNFTISVWFNTTTTSGGRIMGFGSSQIGGSFNYDRHLYMSNSGQLYYGVNPTAIGISVIGTPIAYNDGQWHNAVASTGTAGSKLYVDGVLISNNPSLTSGQSYPSGFWKIGYDKLDGWPFMPTSQYFNGSLDDISLYNTQLSDTEVKTLYIGGQGPGYVTPACLGSAINFTAPTIAGATYSWTGPNGFTSTLQNPTIASLAAANLGVYSLQVTASGCVNTGYTNLTIDNTPAAIGGNVTTNAIVCAGANSGTLTLAGHTGNIVRWESSTDGFTTTTVIPNTTTTQTYTNLNATTAYRAVLNNGSCIETNSTPAVISMAGNSAISNYAFGASLGVFTPLAGGTNAVLSGGTTDEGFFNGIPLGFDFFYLGNRYTTISASTNGWITLGANITNASPVNNLMSGGTPRPVIAPLWDDLDIQNTANVTYLTSGTAGSRVFIIEYLNAKWNKTAPGNVVSFQIRLFESTGRVDYRYRREANAPVSPSGSIGITSTNTGVGNFLSLSSWKNSPQVSASSNIESLIDGRPDDGQVFAFYNLNPSPPTSLTFTSITTNSMTLNWVDNTCVETAYVIYVSLDGITYNYLTQVAKDVTSFNNLGLTPDTRYFYKVFAMAEGRLSTELSGNATTLCVPSVGGAAVIALGDPTTVCEGVNTGTINLSGHTGSIVRWESSLDGFATVSAIANTTTSLTFTNLTDTTSYRAVVKSGSCSEQASSAQTIIVNPASIGGIINADANVCSGSNAGTLTLSGHTGNIVRWESSIDGFATNTTIANTTVSQNYSNLNVNTKYRAVIQSGSCAVVYSTIATITVTGTTSAGSISSDATVCSGSNSGTLTLSGYTGTILRWESSIDGFATPTIIANTSTTQSYTNLVTTTSFRAVVQNGSCSLANSTVATITVAGTTTAGTVTTDATVCSGSNSGTLTLSGHAGSILRWESSLDNFATINAAIGNTSTSQSYTNLTATTSYRAVVKNGSCTQANSIAATITVTPITVGGTISTSASVCSGANTGTLTLSGHTGGIVRWESSTDGFSTVSGIANTSTTLTYTNITSSTSYRAVVQNGSCAEAYATAATITVTPNTVGGSVSTDATVCAGSNSGTLTLSGHTGNILRWESSIDGFATVGTSIANSTTSQIYTNLNATTSFRAVVQNGLCSVVNSNSADITVVPISIGGSISGSATVCSGSNSGTLTLSGYTGSIVRWESSTDGFATSSAIFNTSNSNSYANLTATTSYRAVIQNGSCAEVNSILATITITPISVGGTISSDATVCSGTNSGTLTLSGYTGSILRWESSLDNFATAGTVLSNTTTSYTYTNLIDTTFYRAIIQNGSCSTANSLVATITTTPTTVGGTISSDATVCTGSNSGTLTLSGQTGSILEWEYSIDNFTTVNTIINTSATETYNNLTATTQYRAVVQNGVCPAVNATSATITVTPVSVGGVVNTAASVCSGANTGTLTLSGQTGSIIRWESSLDNFATAGTVLANTTTSHTYTNLIATTSYRAVLQNGACATENSASTTITTTPASIGGTVSTSATVCSGANTGTLTLSGHTGSIVRWESSLDNFATAGTVIANTTTSQSYANLTATTSYRAVVQNGSCAEANAITANITVTPVSIGGTVSASATVCSGTNTGTLTLSGHTGSVISWESSLDNFATAGTVIANTTTSQAYTNLTATTFYRAVVQNGTCAEANATASTITVTPVSIGGTVSTSATVCSGANTGTLTLSGHTGSIVRWESSLDNFATAGTVIANTTTSQAYANLTATTSYRAVVQNGSCAEANAIAANITVTPVSIGGTVSASATVCSGTNTGTLTLSGHTGSIVRWESSLDNFATAGTVIANTTTSQAYTNLTATTSYRAVVQNGICAEANATSATITITPVSVGGTVSTSATVCSGANTGTLTLSGHIGSIVRWESSLDNFATAGTVIANTTTSQAYTNLTATTSYRAVVQNGICTEANATSATITVTPVSVGGTVSTSATVCSGANTGTLTLSGHTGSIVRWESSLDNFATAGTVIANTTTSQAYTNLTATTSYRAVVQNGTCAEANATASTITVTPVSVGGTVSTSATVCSGANTGTLTLSGQTGSILRWELSLDNFATAGIVIPNITISHSYTNLTATTSYRAVVQNGSCAEANAIASTITVTGTTTAGSVSSNANVCTGLNSGTLTLSGHIGNIVRWESSPDGFTSAGIVIANTTTSQTFANLTTTTSYRAVVQNGTCAEANSIVSTITVTPVSVGGAVSSDAIVCSGVNSGILNVIGYSGSVVRWESSLDNFATAGTVIANTTTSQAYTNLTATTSYRAVVQNGTCAEVNATASTIDVTPVSVGGIVNTAATVCSGANTGTLSLAGHTGSIIRWESSLDNFATAGTVIANTTTSQAYTNLTASTSYRAVVQNGTCTESNATAVTITVTPVSIGGTVSTSATVCSGANTAILTLSGHTGSIIRWESSLDNFATAGTVLANTTTSQAYTNLTATTSYRAVVQNGNCAEANATAATITITPVSIGGTVSTSATVCSGTNTGTLTMSGQTGSIIRWESSLDNFATAGSVIANTTTSQGYTNLTATTSYRAVVQNGSCAEANATPVTITVTPVSDGGAVSSDVTVCSGANTGNLFVFGHTGSVVRWESSLDNFATVGTVIANTTTSQTYNNLTTTTSYRVVVKNGTCAEATATSATITVTPVSTGGVISTSTTVCSGANTGTLTLSGHTGNVVRWEFSTDGFMTSPLIINTSAIQNYSNLIATTSYRAVVKNGTCAEVNATPATITVTPVSIGGTINSAATVCSGSNVGTLTLAGNTGSVVRWESSLDNFATAGTAIANTTTSQAYSNIIGTTSYRAIVQNGLCAEASATAVTITVAPVSNGGTINASSTVCSGANTGTLTLSGNTGSIIRWESSLDNFASAGAVIINTSTSQVYNNLTATTSYRAVVQNGSCTEANSVSATISVTPISVGGSVSTAATVCSGANSGTLTLSGHTGSVVGWEFSLDDFATTGTAISNTTTSLIYTDILATTSYRAVVQNGTCAVANATEATITVTPISEGGSVTTATTVCSGSNAGTLTLSGNSGSVIRWESSLDNFATPGNAIANTTTSQAYTNLTATTSYRAVVQNGTCAEANAAGATIAVTTPGNAVLTGNANVLVNQNTGTLELTQYSGNILRWETSIDNFTTSTSLVNTTSLHDFINLNETNYFRVVLQENSCLEYFSNVISVVTNQLPFISNDTVYVKKDSLFYSSASLTSKFSIQGNYGITITASSASTQSGGTLTITSDGQYQYNPPVNFVGTDLGTFGYCFTGLNAPTCFNAPIIFKISENVPSKDNSLVIYPIFSPNGDGVNDSWVIDNIELYPDNSVKIYDRWGSLVYDAKKYDNLEKVWKGNNMFKNESILPPDTYFYLVDLKNGSKPLSGFTVLSK